MVSGVFRTFDPPPTLHLASVSSPPAPKAGGTPRRAMRGWGVNVSESARHWIGLLQYNPSTGIIFARPFLLSRIRAPNPFLRIAAFYYSLCWILAQRAEAESKEKHGVCYPMPELTITSPYVHSRVDYNTFIMNNLMQESTLKVHKNENFFGFDFEFCPISLLVMHK
jgi:hypothetical protein